MQKLIFNVLLLCCCVGSVAQTKETYKDPIPAGVQVVSSRGSVTISGNKIDYTTHTGYLDLKNDTGKLIAKVFFTYYKKDGEDMAKRPVCFTFNGGPGSSSVWLHMGGLGPRRVLLDDMGAATKPPYKVIPNEYSWLDKTD